MLKTCAGKKSNCIFQGIERVYKYPRQAWQFVVHHGGYMKLKQFDILSNDVSCGTTLLIPSQLVVDFYNVSQLVGQVIL